MSKEKTKKKDRLPKFTLVQRYWVEGQTKQEVEQKADKILDTLFKKHRAIGVVVGGFMDPNELRNAAERALDRMEELKGHKFPKPWGRNQSFTHGYQQGVRYAERVIREELTRYHGE